MNAQLEKDVVSWTSAPAGSIKNIAAALVRAQKKMGTAIKDSKNPFFKSSYADLNAIREAVMPSLLEEGIAVLQPIDQRDGKNYVKTLLLHVSGETLESFTEIVVGKQNDPQAQGSGISYARRYGLQAFLNVGAEDDDGEKAMDRVKTGFDEAKSSNLKAVDWKIHPKLLESSHKEEASSADLIAVAQAVIARKKMTQLDVLEALGYKGTGGIRGAVQGLSDASVQKAYNTFKEKLHG